MSVEEIGIRVIFQYLCAEDCVSCSRRYGEPGGRAPLTAVCAPPILGYSKFFVLFGVPHKGKTTNNSIKKLRFVMQNNVQFDIILVVMLLILYVVVVQLTAATQYSVPLPLCGSSFGVSVHRGFKKIFIKKQKFKNSVILLFLKSLRVKWKPLCRHHRPSLLSEGNADKPAPISDDEALLELT